MFPLNLHATVSREAAMGARTIWRDTNARLPGAVPKVVWGAQLPAVLNAFNTLLSATSYEWLHCIVT
jgi:hypothetical protein